MTTYSITETLPDGRTRTVATGLTLKQALAAYPGPWARTIVQHRATR